MARRLGKVVLGFGSDVAAPTIGGVDPSVLAMPAFSPGESLTLAPAAPGDARFGTWALGLDLYVPQPAGALTSLLQRGDANLFLRDNGDGTAGLGVDGVFDGAVAYDAWNRIIVTVTEESGATILRKFVNGAQVGAQNLGATTEWAIKADEGLALFAGDAGETSAAIVASVFFTSVLPDAGQVAAIVASIGAPSDAGFFPAPPSAAALELDFANQDIAPRYGAADVLLEGFGFRTPVALGDSLIGFPSQIGLDGAGPEAAVLLTPGFSPEESLSARLPLETSDLSSFTAVWDLYLPQAPGGFLALLQTDPLNASDGDLFIRSDGGLGISGVYDGRVPVGAWTRVAVTLSALGNGTSTLSKYIDGQFVGSQSVDTARFTLQSNAGTLLLSDNDGETGPVALAHFGVAPRALSADDVAALGGVDADGPFAAPAEDDPSDEPDLLPVRLTEDATFKRGAVFTNEAVDVAGLTFESAFSFRIVTEDGAVADGLTFQIQTERPGVPLLGPGAGGSLGLPVGPFPGVTVAFDTWRNTETGFSDAAENQIRIFVGEDADTPPAAVADAPVTLGSGDTYHAWVAYDGATLRVFVAAQDVKPAAPVIETAVDLDAVLGATTKFGFTGATGGSTSVHDILSWSLTTNAAGGPAGQLLSEGADAVTLLGDATRLAAIDFDPEAPLQLGFGDYDATVEFGFADAAIIDAPTVVNPIDDLLIDQTGAGESFTLADVFGADATDFTVTTSNGATVTAAIVDGVLRLTPGALGHADITVTATAANGATLTDNFRAIVAGPNAYVFAVIPDTQDYTSDAPILDVFGNITSWLVDQKDALGIAHVLHVGDIVQFGAPAQWAIAQDAMGRLDGKLTYTLGVGNHDQQRPGFASAFAFESDIDAYFTPEQVGATAAQGGGVYDGFDVGPDVFGNGGEYANSIRNHYSTIQTPDGVKWLMFGLEFGMPDDVLRWTSEVIEDHLDHRVIIATHAWNGGDGRLTPVTETLTTDNDGWGYAIRENQRSVNGGEDAWRELAAKYPNIMFTFNGHNFMGGAETVLSYGPSADPVFQIFVNYQNGALPNDPIFDGTGGNGALRLVVIDPDNERVTTHTKLVELDRFYDAFPDHEETFENVEIGAPPQIAIAKAGGTEIVQGDGVTATVSLDPAATLGGMAGARFAWFAADGEKLGETDGAPLSVTLQTGTNRLLLKVTDPSGAVSTDEKVVIVEAPQALLTETFDDGDAAGWAAPAVEPTGLFALGTDLGFSLPSIGGVGQIPLRLTFDSSFRPYDNQTGEVMVSFDEGQTFSTLLTLDSTTVPGGDSSLARANETITLDILAPNTASSVQLAWRMSGADNDWWWAIDNVVVAAVTVGRESLFAEDFEGLPLGAFVSPTEGGGDGTDWTDVAPEGWTRDNAAALTGGPAEFRGWTFLDKASWIATAGNQDRDSFTRGQGAVAVADPDEYDDGTNIDPDRFDAFLITPEIDLTGKDGETLQIAFDSSFRPYDGMTGTVEVSFDGGETFSTLLTLDAATAGGDSSLTRANERITLDVDASDAAGAIFRFGMTDAGNDWWWAVDNIDVSVAASIVTTVLDEDFDGLPLQDVVNERDPGRPVWTPVPPAGWTQSVAATTSQGSVEFQGWTFLERDFWIATAGNQDRDSFTLGSGNVAVADPDEWDDVAPGAAGNTDEFDSTIRTPAINLIPLGGGVTAGGAAGVLSVPALEGDEAILLTPTASTGLIHSWTMIFDILLEQTTQSFSALVQTNVANTDDADIYFRNDGATASIGISGDYDGALAYGAWGRIALVVETDATGRQTLRKYLDGAFLDSQLLDDNVDNGSRWSIDAGDGVLLFSEPNGFTSDLYVNALHFTTEALDAAAIAALGRVDGDGPVAAAAGPEAFQLSFDGALGALDYGQATIAPISLAGPGNSSFLVKGSIFGNPDGEGVAALYQQSNGADELLLWQDGADWKNYVFDVVIEPADNDVVGAVFYYQDALNFYRLTMDQQNDRRVLTKVQNGVETQLASETASYRHFAMQDLRIAVVNGEITITLDDDLLFDGPVTDAAPLTGGTVGLYTQNMDRVLFDNIAVNPVTLAARALTVEPAGRWLADLDGDGVAIARLTAAATLSAAGVASHEWLVGGRVVATGETVEIALASGETPVTLRVTDANGLRSEDVLSVDVVGKRAVLAADDFSDGDLAGWTIVDEGTLDGPSAWAVADGALVQASNINSTQQGTGAAAYSIGGDGPFILRDGTYALWDDKAAKDWTDYSLSATLTPNDDDGIGLLFRYIDDENYYKLEADAQTGLVMLTRHLEGRETILARGWHEYTAGEAQDWRIEVEGGDIRTFIDGKAVFGTPVEDRTLGSGTVGLYAWASVDLAFDDVVVALLETPLNVVTGPASGGFLQGTDEADLIISGGGAVERIRGGAGLDQFDFTAARADAGRNVIRVSDMAAGETIIGIDPDADIAAAKVIGTSLQLTLVDDGDLLVFTGVTSVDQLLWA